MKEFCESMNLFIRKGQNFYQRMQRKSFPTPPISVLPIAVPLKTKRIYSILKVRKKCHLQEVTLQKKEFYTWWKVPAKHFKIFHILYIWKPKVAFSVFHFVLLYFSPNKCPGLCWHRPGHSLGDKIK